MCIIVSRRTAHRYVQIMQGGEFAAETEVKTLRQVGAIALLDDFGLIEVFGQDAGKVLQSRTSNDVLALAPGQGQNSSQLDRKGHVQAYFSLHRLDDSYWIVAGKGQLPTIGEQTELYIFREEVTVADRSDEGVFWAVQGAFSRKLLGSGQGQSTMPALSDNDILTTRLWDIPVTVVKKSITGEDGYFLWAARENAETLEARLLAAAQQHGFAQLSKEALNVARVEAGIPIYGLDMSIDNLLPETGLEEQAVSYTKGCYLGQEVMARIKSFGAPRRGLTGLSFPPESRICFPPDTALRLSGQEIGHLRSLVYSPTLQRTIAMAYLGKEHRIPGQELELELADSVQTVVVNLLPFYRARANSDRAREKYDAGLAEFSGGDETRSIEILREALELDPLFADCYEALGVILSRQGQLEEAIGLMKKLAELDPESVMAHANLSVFYVQQGDKEAAEEEKALAMSIRMRKLAEEVTEQQKQEEDRQRKVEEAKERIRMFREVLEIDGDDLLANYGLGNVHVELGEFEEAVPYLKKAIQIKPTHSVAYLALGAAYHGLNQLPEAEEVYRQGVDVAGKRGDMTPLKEMQSRLKQLEALNSPGSAGNA